MICTRLATIFFLFTVFGVKLSRMDLRSFTEVFERGYLNKLAPNVNVIGEIVLKLDEGNWKFTEDFSKLSLLVWQEISWNDSTRKWAPSNDSKTIENASMRKTDIWTPIYSTGTFMMEEGFRTTLPCRNNTPSGESISCFFRYMVYGLGETKVNIKMFGASQKFEVAHVSIVKNEDDRNIGAKTVNMKISKNIIINNKDDNSSSEFTYSVSCLLLVFCSFLFR
ncbi:DgyrCDS724 [Dimorphilus gyrociliatus]|uniref:DgyrCDS724 n=1 Tax=Dimorphilus gyrociliatus TaxID=2664684 RepID=A0A7I8V7A6_9ANNE|nr:DgyrCDS724 [Dimorphilus gyrociliatus]